MYSDQCQNWYEVLLFVVSDFGAFIATVPVLPGSSLLLEAEMKICSLFSPYYGVGRSASCIKRGAIWAATPLERAARAGALCIITRTKSWKPTCTNVTTDASKEIPQVETSLEEEDEWEAWNESGLVNPEKFKLHGQVNLPEGYGIVRLHEYEEVESLDSDGKPFEIPSTYGLLKALIGAFQIASGAAGYHKKAVGKHGTTEFDTRIFVLVFIPYTLMSFINVMGSLFTPEYPCMFMVESEVMDEARGRGASITGTVGRVKASVPGENHQPRVKFVGNIQIRQPSTHERLSAAIAILLTLSVVTLPFCLIAILGAFEVFRGLTPHEAAFYLLFLVWFSGSIIYGLIIGSRMDHYSLIAYILHLRSWKPAISIRKRRVFLRQLLPFARISIFFCSAGVSVYLFYLIGYLITHSEFCVHTDR